MRLTETERIEILIMVGCGHKVKQKVRDLFNTKYNYQN